MIGEYLLKWLHCVTCRRPRRRFSQRRILQSFRNQIESSMEVAAERPLRIGVLVAGYHHKPFTVPVESRTTTTLGDRVIAANIGEQMTCDGWRPFILANMPTNSVESDFFAYMRCFLAVSDGATSSDRRFLRLGDPLCRQLMDSYEIRALVPSITRDKFPLDRSIPIVPVLATAIGQDLHAWRPEPDEIHIIVVLYRNKRLYPHQRLRAERMLDATDCITFDHPRHPVHSDACWGMGSDAAFHKAGGVPLRQFHLRILNDPADRQGPRLPTGELMLQIKFCRGREDEAAPQSNPRAVPRLVSLASDAYLDAVIHSVPPLYMDPVDCIVSGRFISCSYWGAKVLMEDVVCYLKFLPGTSGLPIAGKERERAAATGTKLQQRPREERKNDWRNSDDYRDEPRMETFVNQEMLELLDWVVQIADPDQSRPRLRVLVLVSQGEPHSLYARLKFDRHCWPTNIPTIHAFIRQFNVL